ncbi:MAG: diguanylate cyclase [Sutterella sp.]|nr:diguanylate cyclase [Sutterella sp.]
MSAAAPPFEKLNPERKTRDHLQEAFLGGRTSVTSLRTPGTEDVLLCAYTPVHINSWRLAVMVSKHVASEGTAQFRRVIFIYIASAIIGLFFYAIWMFKVTHEETGEEAERTLYDAGIQKLITVPIRGDAGRIVGTVSVLNPRRTKLAAMLLESVKLSFTLLVQNIRFMKEMGRLAERDGLTGLYNRASFERSFRSLQENFSSSYSVVYIDGNHLHEINNREGHEAGDRQIRAIADALRETFGDEFLALVADEADEAVRARSGHSG